MSLDIFKRDLSDKKKRVSGITKEQINSELAANGYPGLYIETDIHLKFSNSTITIGEEVLPISGMTLIETVKILREHGVSAYLTRNSVGMLPAELLLDFDNKIVFTEEVDVSPKNIDEMHNKNILNVPGLEESSITKTILSVSSSSRNIIYKTDDSTFSYQVDDNRLFINGLLEDTTAMIEYEIDKFFIFMNTENVIELNKLLRSDMKNINNRILMNDINSNNWDKV
ncbi:MAG: hypothetical protein DRQ60_05080 [Gammaproteobacteria bacterium]|nr:MAG: hypothetical protein DRQ60_05080 [Gammaproteobacteria bacterium]RLA68375.1 MAG: hypothetical protein DRQ78_00860 [Campylobacterota bacterium]